MNTNLLLQRTAIKKIFHISCLLILFINQEAGAQLHKYFIRFSDKNGSPYSITNPSAFLSVRSINRRTVQQIPVTTEDIPVNTSYISTVIAQGATVLTRSKWFNGITIECDSQTLQSVISLPFVLGADKIFIKGQLKDAKVIKSCPLLRSRSEYFGTGFNYGGSFNQIHLMNGEYLHNQGYTGNGMVIALLDAGFFSVDTLHAFDSIRTNNQILGTWDFVANDTSVYEDNAHGMMVLSTIAGNVPGELVGTAPAASFWLLRSEDGNTENLIEEYNWNAAAEFADSAGADVISSSLGYTTFDDSTMSHSYADMDGNTCPSSVAADKAVSKGILVLVSAGNQGAAPWHFISAPSDGDSVISVGAVDSAGFHASFSSFGPSADGDIKPNVDAKGLSTTVAEPLGTITVGSGTSFACPVLAGSATCLWQAHPDKTAMEIKTAIEQSAHLYSTPNDSMGFGIPDFQIAHLILSSGALGLPVSDELLSVFPVPFDDQVFIHFYSTSPQTLKLSVVNSLGQAVSASDADVSAGLISTIKVPLPNSVSNGIYFIRIDGKTGSYLRKIIK
jgi:serine protease AprX